MTKESLIDRLTEAESEIYKLGYVLKDLWVQADLAMPNNPATDQAFETLKGLPLITREDFERLKVESKMCPVCEELKKMPYKYGRNEDWDCGYTTAINDLETKIKELEGKP